MRWTNRLFAILGAAAVGSTVYAVPATTLKENYQSIIERNPFGLKPPPPPQTNNVDQAKEKAKTEIFLTGITSVGFPRLPKQAYFYTREQGKKEVTYYALTEGDSKDGIRILNIDPQQRKVRVKMDNAETLLSFETHGVPVAAASGKPGTPGALPLPTPGQPHPNNPVNPLPTPSPGRPIYNANGQAVYQNNVVPGGNASYQNANGNPGFRQIPSRQIRGRGAQGAMIPGGPGNGYSGDMQQPQQEQQPDLAEQYLRMHLNRAAKEREGVPMPPLPTIE